MKIKYNAPVTLSYAFLCTIVVAITFVVPSLKEWLAVPGNATMRWNYIPDYLRLFSYVFDHDGITHLLGNFAIILLIGPQIEANYGAKPLLLMMLITALVTGLINALLLPTGLLGASGIAFMMILLASFTNVSKGEIPLTFLLVIAIYLGQQVYDALFTANSNISQFAHIAGGIIGSLFGFLRPVPGATSAKQ